MLISTLHAVKPGPRWAGRRTANLHPAGNAHKNGGQDSIRAVRRLGLRRGRMLWFNVGQGSWIAGLFKQHGGYELHSLCDYRHMRSRERISPLARPR